jgi:signal peptidase I
MMLGDNSPCSKDGRKWSKNDEYGYTDPIHGRVEPWSDPNSPRAEWEVPEALLIGKAFFVYWPHGVPVWPYFKVNRDFVVPFRPYVERMKWIR